MPQQLPPGCRILEGVITTVAAEPADAPLVTRVNVAPMGPIVDADLSAFILRPFKTSTTYRNLKATGQAIFHVTDDVRLIARGAIGKVRAVWDPEISPQAKAPVADAAESANTVGGIPYDIQTDAPTTPVRLAPSGRGVVLTQACRYYALSVVELDDSADRTRIVARVADQGRLRDFFGFNRAMHAVLEAAILATRLHLTGKASVLAELDRLQVMVDKTGSEAEHQAMDEIRAFVVTCSESSDDQVV